MASLTLSSVVEEQIRKLCLKDFPCGLGSWTKSVGDEHKEQNWGYVEQDEARDGADKEEQDSLIELLSGPMSPWRQEGSWSPEALVVREMLVRTPEGLRGCSIHSLFLTLRMVDKGVSVIDDGLLRFSGLEELVLSANSISDVDSGRLPSSLRVLELYANQVSSLKGLSCRPPPHLQHLGLGANRLGSPADIHHLTRALWPQLVSLDLSLSEFQGQRALVDALATMPSLRTLALEGNPLTLAPSYPGYTVDSLPKLLYLDASRVTPDDRHRFGGLANMLDLIVDQAVATVTVGKIRGVPDPSLSLDDNETEFPVVSYGYLVTYEFLSQPRAGYDAQLSTHSASASVEAALKEKEGDVGAVQQKNNSSCAEEMAKPNSPKPNTVETVDDSVGNSQNSRNVAKHSTAKLAWAESMDSDYTAAHGVADLGLLKAFLLGGLHLTIEEEKVLSWPALDPNPNPGPKANTDKKGGKDLARPASNTCSNQKSKDKKKKKDSLLDLVQDAPIRRTLGSVHVPLQELVTGGHVVSVQCDLGVLLTEQSLRASAPRDKDQNKKTKDDKKKEEKKAKSGVDNAGQRNSAAPKGKGKGRKESQSDVCTDDAPSSQLEPMTVEFSVRLEKWTSASDAKRLHQPQCTAIPGAALTQSSTGKK